MHVLIPVLVRIDRSRIALLTSLLAVALCAALARADSRELPYPRFEPTPPEVVDAMLEMAGVKSGDIVFDLGSGDGRIVIAAAKQFGARAVGVELDRDLVRQSRRDARTAGVADRVEFQQKDLFKVDLGRATVVTLYLLPEVNLTLRPKLLRELAPGTRVVSHTHDMGDWAPRKTLQLDDAAGQEHRLHLWVVPER